MTNIPPVTVLMPAYNAEQYIREAIDSVLAQTFTDFEFLIINDGSTDATAAIINSYTDSRIRVVTQENKGLVTSLNMGLQLAKGKWIARFDADDVCYPERLLTQVDFLTMHPEYILVGSEADYADGDGQYLFTHKFRNYEDEQIRRSHFRMCPVIHSSVMYLKDIVIEAGGYNPGALTFEDHLLWHNLAAFGKIKNVHQPLIKVHFNAESATVDEKWRGKEFNEIKQRSIANGSVTAVDAERLREIITSQDFKKFKDAAYNSMIGKKYLWNQYDPAKARQHLRKAISIMPSRLEPYLLYAMSWLPAGIISSVYKNFKKT
ncbi:MAG: glycosyltransferase [Taibaiella sp.]|nr:glycosyltransferase [Taibaiella sp.]